MKTAIKAVVAALFLFAAISVSAQQPHHGRGGARGSEQMLNKMTTELSLTDEQIAQVKDLHKQTYGKMQAKDADKGAIMKERTAKMKKILTKEQFSKWVELQKARKHGPGKQGAEKCKCDADHK